MNVKTAGQVNSIVWSYSDRKERDRRLEHFIAVCRGAVNRSTRDFAVHYSQFNKPVRKRFHSENI